MSTLKTNKPCPTRRCRALRGRRDERARTRLPFGREATGWEVAYAALFLTCDESVYITAQILAVDCGLSGIS